MALATVVSNPGLEGCFSAQLGWRACYEIEFLDRHRGFACVLIKLWQAITLRNKSAWDHNKYGWSDNREH